MGGPRPGANEEEKERKGASAISGRSGVFHATALREARPAIYTPTSWSTNTPATNSQPIFSVIDATAFFAFAVSLGLPLISLIDAGR